MTILIKSLKGKKKKKTNSGDNSHVLINDQLDMDIYDSKVCGAVSWSSRQVCTGAFNTMGNTVWEGKSQEQGIRISLYTLLNKQMCFAHS